MKTSASDKVLEELDHEDQHSTIEEGEKGNPDSFLDSLGGPGPESCDCSHGSRCLLFAVSTALCSVLSNKIHVSRLNAEVFQDLVKVNITLLKKLIK